STCSASSTPWSPPMTAEPVTASIHIDAPPERVYEYFTRPEAIVTWMGETALLEAEPGGRFHLDIKGAPVRGRFLRLDPPHRLLISWGFAGSARLPTRATPPLYAGPRAPPPSNPAPPPTAGALAPTSSTAPCRRPNGPTTPAAGLTTSPGSTSQPPETTPDRTPGCRTAPPRTAPAGRRA